MQDGPGGGVGPPLRVLFNAAGHVYLDEEGVRLAEEIDSLGKDLDIGDDGEEEGHQLVDEIDSLDGDRDSGDDGSDRGGWGRPRPRMGPDPFLWRDDEMRTRMDGNPQ